MKKDRYSFDPVITSFVTHVHPKNPQTMKSFENLIPHENDYTACQIN